VDSAHHLVKRRSYVYSKTIILLIEDQCLTLWDSRPSSATIVFSEKVAVIYKEYSVILTG